MFCHDGEYLLIIKTMASEYEAVTAAIQELHSYDLPEILAFDISQGEPGFLQWIAGSLDKARELYTSTVEILDSEAQRHEKGQPDARGG